MIVITSGKKYLDIDGYASMIAYRELLILQGYNAVAVSSAPFNYSVTKSLRNMPYKLDDYQVKENDEFILIDLSNKDFFEDFVKLDKIMEIIDHHPGYHDYWHNILGDKATIEAIGSVATMIVEKFENNNLINRIDEHLAKLLMAAILDNTLNFTADITSNRDKRAYHVLESIIDNASFPSNYFLECQSFIEDNLDSSIVNDLKIEDTNTYLPRVLGQLTIWDISSILMSRKFIDSILGRFGENWLINIISLKENKSYIYCSNELVKSNVIKLFDCEAEDTMVIVSPAKLRKEIMNIALTK